MVSLGIMRTNAIFCHIIYNRILNYTFTIRKPQTTSIMMVYGVYVRTIQNTALCMYVYVLEVSVNDKFWEGCLDTGIISQYE